MTKKIIFNFYYYLIISMLIGMFIIIIIIYKCKRWVDSKIKNEWYWYEYLLIKVLCNFQTKTLYKNYKMKTVILVILT